MQPNNNLKLITIFTLKKKKLSELLDAYPVIMFSLIMLPTPMDYKTSEEKYT